MAQRAQEQTHCNVSKSSSVEKYTSKASVSYTKRKNRIIQPSETWIVTESKSLSTHFLPATPHTISTFRKCPNKPLPPILHRNTSKNINVSIHRKISTSPHARKPSLSFSTSNSCEIQDFFCCVTPESTMSPKAFAISPPPSSAAVPAYPQTQQKQRYNSEIQKKTECDTKKKIESKKQIQHLQEKTESAFAGVTSDELYELILNGECLSDCSSDTQCTPSPEMTDNMMCNQTTVIPSILVMSPQQIPDAVPTISLSNKTSQEGDKLIYNMISYAISDEESDYEEHIEAYKLSQSLSALHQDINALTLDDIKLCYI